MSTTQESKQQGGAPEQGTKLKRHLGPIGLLFTAIGSIIGSGWLFGAYNASQIAGPAAIFSWLIAGLMVLMIGLCYAELGPMFPISGGVVRYPHLVWGSFASYSLGFITWISSAAVPAIEVMGALTYATKYAPFTIAQRVANTTVHTLTPVGILIAVILMAIFVVINYYGVRLFAQINNVLVWWKLVIILLVIATFLVMAFGTTQMGTLNNFTSLGFAPSGAPAIFTCIATAGITFSFLGFRQGIELAGETSNPKRNIPFAIIGSVGITAVIYALLQVAFTMGIPEHVLQSSGSWSHLTFTNDFGPLAALATMGGLTWLAYLLYADAIISPTDTGLIYTTIAARVSYAQGRNGNAPRWLARTNSHGVPHWSLFLTFLVGLVMFLPFPSWQQLVGFITSATVLSFGSGPLVVATLRRQMAGRARPFKLPGGYTIPLIAFYCANLIVYWGGWTTNMKIFITILLGYILLVIFEFTGDRKTKPKLDFRAGAIWLIPWLVLVGVQSWLMDPAEHPVLFWWAFLSNAVITVVVFILALNSHLPLAKVQQYIDDAEEESRDEEELAV
ncbi:MULTISPECIES: APC family permease [unclassified Arthrobacter]|uniref:APC family permease n=1 Tax=unclassified Arthrobacter TaxID=235627 RepID=UPI00159E63DC|nr:MULTISPECIES: APC family permease [unclassified Arthrobacter]MCQ9164836.1 APC family permease [Arthrobacter sp. STN4]NVM98715.1 APC family permease [Arthrobacter sp. SDTb3-6]